MNREKLQEEAWVGDAVLALFAREWLLRHPGPPGRTRQELFKEMTSNSFLNALGEPTAVEARIGRIYADKGLQPAFQWIETELLPLFRKKMNKWQRAHRRQS